MTTDRQETEIVMTTLGENLWEARRPLGSLVTPKFTTLIGNWNVRTMYTTGAAAKEAKEMRWNGHQWAVRSSLHSSTLNSRNTTRQPVNHAIALQVDSELFGFQSINYELQIVIFNLLQISIFLNFPKIHQSP